MDNSQEQSSEKGKKAWYKKWWVWAIAIIVIIGISSNKNDSKTPVPNPTPQSQITSDKATPKPSEAPKQEAYTNTAESKDLFSGEWEVGKDIKAGKYSFSAPSGSGNFFVYDKSGMPVTNEILSAEGGDLGIKVVETYIEDGQKITISGLKTVKCVPADTSAKTEFTAGIYYVGREISEGTYIASSANGKSGNFFVYDKSGIPKVNEILGNGNDNLSIDKVKVTLKNRDKMQISGMDKVVLKAE